MLRVLLTPCSYLLNHLPHSVLVSLGNALGWFLFSVIRFRRSVVLTNVQLAFGTEKTSAELLQIARKNYTHYALTGLEWIQSITWRRQDFLERTECHWVDVQKRMNEGEGGLLLTSHLGNWEFAIQSASAHGMPCDVIVKRQGTRMAQDFLEWFRTRFGAGVIYESGTTRDIFGFWPEALRGFCFRSVHGPAHRASREVF
ncbi:hypothetical protein EBQ90_00755 [bacterium]|nr:hypothetical protein [bacterium]